MEQQFLITVGTGGKQKMIYPCNCTHEYQDKKYGKGNRVFNETMSHNYRCSVCGNMRKEIKAPKKEEKK